MSNLQAGEKGYLAGKVSDRTVSAQERPFIFRGYCSLNVFISGVIPVSGVAFFSGNGSVGSSV